MGGIALNFMRVEICVVEFFERSELLIGFIIVVPNFMSLVTDLCICFNREIMVRKNVDFIDDVHDQRNEN